MRPCVRAVILATAMALSVAGGSHADGDGHTHGHDKLRAAGEPAPEISLAVFQDKSEGYNLHIITSNFRFSPERTGKVSEIVEGHAHLYVNGVKKARIYGNWFHIPGDWINPGENIVRVTLNDNVHMTWAIDGVAIAAEAVVDMDGPFTGAQIVEMLTLDEVKTIEVSKGTDVRLVLHAENPLELHLHGYDLIARAAPGSPAVFTFRADRSGRFPLEAHGIEDLLGRKDRALAFVEVRKE